MNCASSLFPNRIILFFLPISTFMYLWRFIFSQDQSAYFAAAKQADRSWEYINRSQILECRNWGWGCAVSFLEIHNLDIRYSVVYTGIVLEKILMGSPMYRCLSTVMCRCATPCCPATFSLAWTRYEGHHHLYWPLNPTLRLRLIRNDRSNVRGQSVYSWRMQITIIQLAVKTWKQRKRSA